MSFLFKPLAAAERQGRVRPADLRADPQLYQILLDHAFRGIRVQLLLRAALVAFVVLTVVIVPPVHDRIGCWVTAGAYAVWATALAWLSQQGGEQAVRYIWPALFVDLLALAVLSVLASASEQSWTADILVNGFFVIPMLATTQLRPGVGIAVTVPTVAVYLASSITARHANHEPWASIVLRTGVLAALSLSCVVLSWVQRSRVLTIAQLVKDRTDLTGQLVDVEGQARRDLAEELHDGALQYVLAARQDLEDARARGDAESFDRIEHALRESSSLLRSKVTQLHPAVLERAGLLAALEELTRTTARGGLAVDLAAPGWDPEWRSPLDDLLYTAARELLVNVTKHARATSAQVGLGRDNSRIRLTVSDNGVGFAQDDLTRRLAEGHIGLASQRIRVEAAGGQLRVRTGDSGTVAEIEVPVVEAPPVA